MMLNSVLKELFTRMGAAFTLLVRIKCRNHVGKIMQ
jgi:hypothetical protein